MTDFTKRILAFKTKVKIPERRIADPESYDYQKESREREERLMSIVDSQSERLEKISATLEKIADDLNEVK